MEDRRLKEDTMLRADTAASSRGGDELRAGPGLGATNPLQRAQIVADHAVKVARAPGAPHLPQGPVRPRQP